MRFCFLKFLYGHCHVLNLLRFLKNIHSVFGFINLHSSVKCHLPNTFCTDAAMYQYTVTGGMVLPIAPNHCSNCFSLYSLATDALSSL